MDNKTYLQMQIDRWLTNQGESPDWERSANPAGTFLRTTTNGFRVLILDSVIEDNDPKSILEVLVPFLDANMRDSKRWILNSNLNLKEE